MQLESLLSVASGSWPGSFILNTNGLLNSCIISLRSSAGSSIECRGFVPFKNLLRLTCSLNISSKYKPFTRRDISDVSVDAAERASENTAITGTLLLIICSWRHWKLLIWYVSPLLGTMRWTYFQNFKCPWVLSTFSSWNGRLPNKKPSRNIQRAYRSRVIRRTIISFW